MVKKIRFRITEDGEVTTEVEGAAGAECEAMTAPFEAALGTVSQREYKDAYYNAASETVSAQQGETRGGEHE